MVGLTIIQLLPITIYGLIIWKFVDFTNKQQESQVELDDDPVDGLGGWLILVGFGLISGIGGIATLLGEIAIATASHFSGMGENEDSDALSSLDSLAALDWSIFMKIAIYLVLLLSFIPLIFLFFTKSHYFPKIFIAFNVCIVLFASLVPFAINLLPLHVLSEQMRDQTTMIDRFIEFAIPAILIAYMLVSKRVKATFVKQ